MQRNIFEGSDFLLYDIDNNPVALSRNCALKIKNNLIDVTTKDSQNWQESMSSVKDWSIEFEGLVSYGSSELTTSFFTSQFQVGEPFFIQMGVIQAGFTHVFWGEVAVESVSIDADNGEVASYSGSLKGIGKIEFTNNGTPAQSGYLKVENDPIFRGSAAFNITNTNKSDWTNGYNKSPNSIGFNTVGNQTTLNLILRDGTSMSSSFTQVGTGSGSTTPIDAYTKIQSDSRFQPLGNYVGSQFLIDSYYSKNQIDNRGFLTSVNWSDIMAKPLIPSSTSQLANDSGFITGYSEVDTLDSVLGRGDSSNKNINVSGKAKFNGSLSIPTSAPATPNSGEHYIYSTGTFGSTGSTGGAIVAVLNDLNDVTDTGSIDGQILMKQNGLWKNANLPATNLGNFFTKSESTSLFKSIGYVPDWSEVTSKPNIPTLVSQLANDIGYVTANIVNGYAMTTTVNSQISALASVYHPLENQRLSTGSSVEFARGKFNNALSIPTTAPNSPNSGEHYIYSTGTFGSTGSTGGGGTFDYNELLNRPTSLSQFTNNLGNYGNWITQAQGDSRWILKDGISYAGFASNDLAYPYFRHESSGQVIRLLRHDQVTNAAFIEASYTPTASTIALRNGSGHLSATYLHNTNNDIDSSTISDIMTTNGSDGYLRRSGVNAVRNWLGLGSNNSAITLQYVTDRGNTTNNLIGITYDGVGNDPYGIMSVTRGTGGNYSYYGMTRSGSIGWGIGIDTSGRISFGLTANGSNNWTMQSIPHTFDASGGVQHSGRVSGNDFSSASWYYTNGQAGIYSSTYQNGLNPINTSSWQVYTDSSNTISLRFMAAGNNIRGYIYGDSSNNFGFLSHDGGWSLRMDASKNAFFSANAEIAGTLTVGGASSLRTVAINNGSVLYHWNADNSYAFQSDMRGDILHQYVLRASDGAPLQYKANWYDGTKYHSWSMDSLGFVASSKITAVTTGNGAATYGGALETRGINAGITFHYPANYAAPLYMNSAGTLIWGGAGIYGTDIGAATLSASNYVAGGRVYAGWDSGVAGSVSANAWFRSNGATGWYNSTYGGGVWMDDTTWVKTYGGKGFLVDSPNGIQVYQGNIQAVNGSFKSYTYKGMTGDYDTNGFTDKIIWTIGDGWNTIGTHYGLGYSYNSSLYSAQHQLVGRSNGNTTLSLNLTSGGAIFTGKVVAPAIEAQAALIIPTAPPSNPEAGKHYLYSTG